MTHQDSRARALFLSSTLLALGAPAASAQEATLLIQAGDVFPGVNGSIDFIDDVAVSGSSWLVEARTDMNETVLIGPNGVLGVEGDALPTPAGSAIVNWDGPVVNDNGDRSSNIIISGTGSAIYWNDVYQLAEGDFGPTPAFSPGSPYIDFRDARVNDANQLLVQGSVDDPAINFGGLDGVLLIRNLDPAGALLSENIVAMVGDLLPGMTAPEAVRNFHANGNTQLDFNDNGEVFYGVNIFAAFGNVNDAYYIDGNLIAREGEVDPVTGRIWRTLEDSCALNNFGGFAYRGRYDVTGVGGSGDWAIIKNNTELLGVENGTLPAIAPNVFGEFAQFTPSGGPVRMDDLGNVYWFGEWYDVPGGTTMGRAVFRDSSLFLSEPVTVAGGLGTTSIRGDSFDVSDDGQTFIFVGRSGRDVFLVESDLFEEACFGNGGVSPGCTACTCGNDALMSSVGGCLNSAGQSAVLLPSGVPAASSDSLRFTMTGGNPSTFAILASAPNALPNMGPCPPGSGIQAPTLDGLRCIGGGLIRHGTRPTNANGEIGVTTNGWGPPNGPIGGLIAASGFTAGQTRRFQAFYRENPALSCGTGQNTTQSISTIILP